MTPESRAAFAAATPSPPTDPSPPPAATKTSTPSVTLADPAAVAAVKRPVRKRKTASGKVPIPMF